MKHTALRLLVRPAYKADLDKLYLLLQRAYAAWRSPSRELTRLLLWRLGIAMPERALAAGGKTAFAALRTLVTALPPANLQLVIDALEDESGPAAAVANGFRPLTWEMLAELSRVGTTVGSHTKSLALLTNEGLRKVNDRTTGSRQDLDVDAAGPAHSFSQSSLVGLSERRVERTGESSDQAHRAASLAAR